jgi:hypothetical protein
MFTNNSDILDATFWRIILASWSMMEIDNLAGDAKSVERSTSWEHDIPGREVN